MIEIKHIDNFELLKSISSESVNMIYGDILYGTGRDFGDYKDLPLDYDILKEFYYKRLIQCKRVLTFNGCIYFQMDTRINHWMRIWMDEIFGYNNFRNEIVWCYNSQGKTKDSWNKKHDVILFYTKSNEFIFNSDIVKDSITNLTYVRFKKEIDKYGYYTVLKNGKRTQYKVEDGSLPKDWIEDITYLSRDNKEVVGYMTQKPESLIERFILASTNKNDLVIDLFLGSGTSAIVCKNNQRNFIGCDININSINITNKRIGTEHETSHIDLDEF